MAWFKYCCPKPQGEDGNVLMEQKRKGAEGKKISVWAGAGVKKQKSTKPAKKHETLKLREARKIIQCRQREHMDLEHADGTGGCWLLKKQASQKGTGSARL